MARRASAPPLGGRNGHRWAMLGRHRRHRTVVCAQVREELSAVLDGEAPDDLTGPVADHVAACPACRRFEMSAVALNRALRIEVLAPMPDLRAEILARVAADMVPMAPAPAPAPAPASGWLGRGERRPSSLVTAGLTRWAVVVVPLGLAASSLTAGAFAKPHIVPSHPVTPCIVSLTGQDRALH